MSILRHFSIRTLQLQGADFCLLQAYSRHRTLGYELLQCQCIDIQINNFFLLNTNQIGQKKRPNADDSKLSPKRLLSAQNRSTCQ